MSEINPEFNKGPILHGQQIDPETGVGIPYTKQTVPYTGDVDKVTGFEGDLNTEIQDVNQTEAIVRIEDPDDTLGAILDGIILSAAITIPSIQFPPTLTGVGITYNVNTGAGSDDHPADQQSFTLFGSGTGTLTPNSTAQGSASIIPDVQPLIVERFHEFVDAMEYTLYMADGATHDDIRTKLGTFLSDTVNAWPQFHPEPVTITAKGQSASVSAKADTRVFCGGTLSAGQTGYEWGNGSSKETGTNVKTVRISATLHDEITIADDTQTETASADADASTDIFASGSDGEEPAIPNTKSVSADVTGSISPTTIPATSPIGVPTSGLYARITPGSRKFGIRTIYQVVVVDFATLAP